MKPSAIFLCIVFLLAAVSCGKGKVKSVFPTSDVIMPRGLYLQGDSSGQRTEGHGVTSNNLS